jgi:hypothetical protein
MVNFDKGIRRNPFEWASPSARPEHKAKAPAGWKAESARSRRTPRESAPAAGNSGA